MPEQPSSDRFKAEMPQIPGVSGPGRRGPLTGNPAFRLVLGLLAVLLVCFLAARWLMRPEHSEPAVAAPAPQIEVPNPAPDPNTLVPRATEIDPGIATITEMAKTWSSKDFYYKDRLTGENVPALLIRVPTGSATQPGGYWALAMKAAFGDCGLEYVTDMGRLKSDYGFAGARHPMVGNPCSRTIFDPLKMSSLPGNIWVRGAIVQGSDLRPPLGIQIEIRGKNILATRME